MTTRRTFLEMLAGAGAAIALPFKAASPRPSAPSVAPKVVSSVVTAPVVTLPATPARVGDFYTVRTPEKVTVFIYDGNRWHAVA